MADELWGPCDGKTIKEHAFGKGKVVWGRTLEEVFAQLELIPDFRQLTQNPGYPLRHIHRRVDEADIYFVANPNPRPNKAEPLPGVPVSGPLFVECGFRVAGKQPELWHPDIGRIQKPAVWREQSGQTILSLRLDPGGSVFVVFRERSAGTDPVAAVKRDANTDVTAEITTDQSGSFRLLARKPGHYELKTVSGRWIQSDIKPLPEPVSITGPWTLRFPQGGGAPEAVTLENLISWTEHESAGVKYFSGTATYSNVVRVPPELIGPGRKLFLDLGKVQVIAQLTLNGRDLGTLWKPPFQIEVTDAIQAGDNVLEIKVVNLWPNRLIGDEQLPDDCEWQVSSSSLGAVLRGWPRWLLEGKPSPTGRLAFTTYKAWPKDAPLLESGLLGPVMLCPAVEVSVSR